ncbi:FMN-binding protein [Gordonia sp. L191]|uniref:FMN-binding protein n=1 Tax=Gordonia TaxID=2053 RepID=UPI001AD7BA61|nr:MULTISPECIES: FMN-binding protein [Gordonia]QTI68445.1 FMN-binding protein [Gordonia polyisoprenivorans]WHU48055.1 FMN-binding protein [Gordonia sp. L191]
MTRSIRTMVRKDEFVTVTRATGVVAAVAALGLATAACGSDDATASDTTQSTGAAASGTSATSAAGGSGEYKNGTFSATGHYVSPGGPQQIGVTVTLDDSTITKVDLDRSQTRGTSAEFQAKFASGINSEVVGKNIDDLDVHKVSGSSLTSGGFNDAIAQIKSQARA